jgi:tRNA A37 methylthiotransferase MiaB
MMTPNTALPIIDDLIETYRGKKVFKFLHVPVQSGSDETLSKMRRKYRIKDFKELVNRFRSSIPDLSIATDVICGFPGESEEQFVESLSLVEWLRPSMLNISRFWPRPGTEAAVLEGQFPSRITKDRSRRIDELWERVVRDVNNNWIGWEGNLLLDEVGHSGAKIGRNDSYKAVAVKTNVEPGESIRVRITGAARGYLLGEEI